MADKYFDREEAEALLPLIRHFLAEAVEQKRLIDEVDEDLARAMARIMALGGSIPPSAELARRKAEREQHLESLQQAVGEIQETGCVVKDLESGLVDFPSWLGDKEVYLCWKLGEPRIGYYHGIDEGFAGRKPLEESAEDEPPSGGPRPV